ncbi:1077_t:CDS:2 [Funneliformis mosseae]|uniref:1077_t:CDS:1 n=1 Tax=Funneliformis mosseae TaxID=27381 RepID=A0A9N9A529_FUNMO|nr:1077_t:CDS:2 [Funneliformis mosseae]
MSNDPSPETLPPIDDTQTKTEETPKNAVETVLQQLVLIHSL